MCAFCIGPLNGLWLKISSMFSAVHWCPCHSAYRRKSTQEADDITRSSGSDWMSLDPWSYISFCDDQYLPMDFMWQLSPYAICPCSVQRFLLSWSDTRLFLRPVVLKFGPGKPCVCLFPFQAYLLLNEGCWTYFYVFWYVFPETYWHNAGLACHHFLGLLHYLKYSYFPWLSPIRSLLIHFSL